MSSRFSGKGNDGAQAHRSRSTFLVVAMALMVAGLFAQTTVAGANATASQAAAAPTIPGSVYTPLAQAVRVQTETPLTAGGTIDVTVVGGSGQAPAGATAVVLTVTQNNNDAGNYLKVYATGTSEPAASAVNAFYPNEIASNLVTVGVNNGTKVTIKTLRPAHVLVDEIGYFSAPASGSTAGLYNPVSPVRITDTRSNAAYQTASSPNATNPYPNANSKLVGAQPLHIQVTGSSSAVPAGATAVVVNIAAVNDKVAGYLQAYGATRQTNSDGTPATSAVNFNGQGAPFAGPNETCQDGTAGDPMNCDIVSTRVIVVLDSNGGFNLISNTSVDAVVDLNGWFTSGTGTQTSGAPFNPTTPSRVFTTQTGTPVPNGLPAPGQSATSVSPGSTVNVKVGNAGDSAGIINVTVDKQCRQGDAVTCPNQSIHTDKFVGFLTVWPAGGQQPQASDINFPQKSLVSNEDYAALGPDGSVNIFNGSQNYVDILVDNFDSFSAVANYGATGGGNTGGNTVTVSAGSSSLAAGATTTVTATVKDANGAGVNGDALDWTVSGTGCGTVNPTTSTTAGGNATTGGTATTQYTAGTTAGSCTVTATEHTGSGTPATKGTGSTTITTTTSGGSSNPHQKYTVSCSPTNVPPSTTAAPTQGESTCSVSGLPANATVDLALFPTQGANAPSNSSGTYTFTPTTGNEAQGIGTTNNGAAGNGAFIEKINGQAQGTQGNVSGNTTTQVNGANTGTNGTLSVVLNSFVPDSAQLAVWTNSDNDNNLGLDPTTHQPNQDFGISQPVTWAVQPAPAGDTCGTGNCFVQSVNHQAGTFVGCQGNSAKDPTATCLTYNYNQSPNNTFCYNGTGTSLNPSNPYPLNETQWDQYLSGFTPQPSGSTNFPPVVPGDTINIAAYNPTGPSSFCFVRDVPMAPTGLTATSGSAGTVTLNWTAPANPDVINDTSNSAGYAIWRATVTGGVVGTWTQICNDQAAPGTGLTTCRASGGTAPPTTFTDTSAAVSSGGTFAYAVAAVPNTANGGVNSEGPLTSTQQVTVAGTPPPSPLNPVIVESILTQGTNTGNNPNVLDNGDTLQFILANVSSTTPLTVANNASFVFADNYGEQSSVTCGTNATCTISNNGTQLNIALTGAPTQLNPATAGSGSPTPSFLNTGSVGDALVSMTGVSNSAGAVNLAVSGLFSCDAFINGPNYPVTRMFDGTSTTGNIVQNNDNFCNSGPAPITPLNPQLNNVTATVPNTVTIGKNDPNAATGDPITVYNAAGQVIGTGTYNSTTGTTITTTSNFNNGDELYVVYQDTNGNLDNSGTGPSNQPSFSLPVGVLNYKFSPKPIASTGTLTNNQSVTVTLSGVTPNGTVYLKLNGSQGCPCGTASVGGTQLTTTPQAFTADSAGNIQIIYTASATASTTSKGTDILTACTNATCSGATKTDTYTYSLPVSPTNSSVANECGGKVPDDNTTFCTIRVTLNDTAGNPSSGQTVTLSQNAGSHSTICDASGTTCGTAGGSFQNSNFSTNNQGVVIFKVKDAFPESVVYTATDNTAPNNGTQVAGTTTVQFVQQVSNTKSTLTATPAGPLTANGTDSTTIQATVLDASGNPIPGYCVTLSQNGSAVITNTTPNGGTGCNGANSETTDSSGRATWTATDTKAETVTFHATGPTLNGAPGLDKSVQVTYNPGPAVAAKSTIVATTPPSDNSHSNDIANDGITLVTLTSTFKDANNNPTPNQSVTISSTKSGGGASGAVICSQESDAVGGTGTCAPTVTVTTNSSGQVVAWARDATAEAVVFTATDNTTPTPVVVNNTDNGGTAVTFDANHVTINTVGVSPTTAGNTNATYSVNFTSKTALAGPNNSITLVAPCGTNFPASSSSYTVTDTTLATTQVVTGATPTNGTTPPNWPGPPCAAGKNNQVAIAFAGVGTPLGGDTYIVTAAGVTNTTGSQNGASSPGQQEFSMYTSADPGYTTKFGAFSTT